jgi:hypothetical protein
VSHGEPLPADPGQVSARAAPDEQFTRSLTAFAALVERITPWLFEVGDWTFGGLIAFTLLVMASLITVGPVDPAIMVSMVAFALALPLDLAGLVLLRLVPDLQRVGFEEEVTRAFQEAGVAVDEHMPAIKDVEALRKRRTRHVLGYCLGIAALSVLLTLTGLVAALWHMAWWIGVAFVAMALISQGLVILALAASPPLAWGGEGGQRR